MASMVYAVESWILALMGWAMPDEREEFSLYCIVEGETFTVPLAKDHYILDVTTGTGRLNSYVISTISYERDPLGYLGKVKYP